jgi:hypothetical protein
MFFKKWLISEPLECSVAYIVLLDIALENSACAENRVWTGSGARRGGLLHSG